MPAKQDRNPAVVQFGICEMNDFLYSIFGLTGVGHLLLAQRGHKYPDRIPAPVAQLFTMKSLHEIPEVKELRKIVQGIKSNLTNAVSQALEAGELLTKIKSDTKYGDWNEVLQFAGLSFKTAQRYMAVWQNRAQVNLNEIKTLSDAENAIDRIGRIPIPTTQNEPLTHEKTSTSPRPVRHDAASIVDHRPNARETKSTDQKTGIKGGFQADPIPRDNSRAYLSDVPCGETEKDYPASEPRVHTTPEDTALAHEFAGYPKTIAVIVHNEQEEFDVRKLMVNFADRHGETESASKTPARDLIRKLTGAYKELTGRTLLVTGADAAQVKRLIQMNGVSCRDEIVLTFRTACQATSGWYATNKSHQLSTFVQNYNSIRNELAQESQKQDKAKSINPQNYIQ